MNAFAPTMHRLRPFSRSVTVIDSPVDEEQRDSGLILKLNPEAGHDKIHRGVVLHVAPDFSSTLTQGDVIFFTDGTRIVDVIVVQEEHIIAYIEEGA